MESLFFSHYAEIEYIEVVTSAIVLALLLCIGNLFEYDINFNVTSFFLFTHTVAVIFKYRLIRRRPSTGIGYECT